jgi:hypothetical protein
MTWKGAYHRAGAPHDGIIDPVAETMLAYRRAEPGYLLVASAQAAERVSAEPFEAVVFSVRGLRDPSEDDE